MTHESNVDVTFKWNQNVDVCSIRNGSSPNRSLTFDSARVDLFRFELKKVTLKFF